MLFLSTGPGALTALGALQEAYATGVPLLVIASQVPRSGHGPAPRHAAPARRPEGQRASTSPRAPPWCGRPPRFPACWPTRRRWPSPRRPDRRGWRSRRTCCWRPPPCPRWRLCRDAVTQPDPAARTRRCRCGAAEFGAAPGDPRRRRCSPLDRAARRRWSPSPKSSSAPVVSTVGGKGAIAFDHPLSAASWIEDRHTTELLEDADVLLAVGTAMGEVTSNYFTFAPRGQLIHVDAEARVLEANHPALAHPRRRRARIGGTRRSRSRRADDAAGARTAAALRKSVQDRLAGQDLATERALMRDLRAAVPAVHADVLGHDDRRLLGMVGVGSARRRVPLRAGRRRPRVRVSRGAGRRDRHRTIARSPSPATAVPCTRSPNWPPHASTTPTSPG